MTDTGGAGEPAAERLVSLDVFRGATMFLLVAEGAGVYEALTGATSADSLAGALVTQFHHHPWNGLRFWDLVQPFFMFIVGVAMAFSYGKRWERGDTWAGSFRHVAYRCLMLLLLGVGLHCGYAGRLVWELWNVLSQLSVTILIAFLIMRLPVRTQILVSLGLLLASDLAYRFWPIGEFRVPGDPFVKLQNFGAWMDTILMDPSTRNSGGWVAVNAIPTAAHTIWGVLAGRLLRGPGEPLRKVKTLVVAGLAGLVLGYGMDWTAFEPIVKRICTVSFIFASGGWCLVTLALFYWLADIRGYRRPGFFVAVVGMNPIFIYLFSETVGKQWFNGFVAIFSGGVLGWVGVAGSAAVVLNALAALALEWYLCYWLYQRRILIRI
jgi:predicted acyltransferase